MDGQNIDPPRTRRIREVLRRVRDVVRRCRRERRAKFFRNLDRVGAIVLVKQSSIKIGAILAIFGPFEIFGIDFFETLNGRLPLEDGSDWRETLPKRVSDDPQHLIFRRQKKNGNFFVPKKQFFAILAKFLKSNDRTDVKIEFYAKKYTYELIFSSVRLKIAKNTSAQRSEGPRLQGSKGPSIQGSKGPTSRVLGSKGLRV